MTTAADGENKTLGVRGKGPKKIFREYLGDITEITSAEDVDQETWSYIDGDAER